MNNGVSRGSEIRNSKSENRNPFARWRNAILGTLLVLAGLTTAIFTLLARRLAEPSLVSMGAIASLVFVLLISILIVPPLTRSAFAEISHGFPVDVTTGGVIFIVVLIIVAFAAWNTGNNLLFMVFSIMLSTLFVSWVAARASLRDLTVSARFPDHIFAGEPAEVLVTVRNAKRLLPSFSVPTRFPFGFFRHRRRLKARDVDIVVYPKPEPIADELHLLPLQTGQTASYRRGAGHDLLLLRDYQPRDELRYIDWKATARARRLTVREFTAEDERRITIMLDTRLTKDIDKENFRIRFESGVIQAASLVKHFVDERADVRLILGEERGSIGRGPEHLYACLRRLAVVQPNEVAADDEWPAPLLDDEHLRRHHPDGNYLVLLTAAERGSIPPQIWRRAFVIYL